MKKIFIIFIITSLSLSGPLGSDSFSVGLGSETMGIYGMWNLNYQLNDIFFISAGSFLIPFFGIEGAAIATLIAMFVYNAVKFLFLWFAFGLQPFNKNTFKVVLVILAFLGVFYFWPQEKEDLIITAISVLLKTLIITSLFGTIVFRLKLSKEINTLIVTVLKKLGFSSP